MKIYPKYLFPHSNTRLQLTRIRCRRNNSQPITTARTAHKMCINFAYVVKVFDDFSACLQTKRLPLMGRQKNRNGLKSTACETLISRNKQTHIKNTSLDNLSERITIKQRMSHLLRFKAHKQARIYFRMRVLSSMDLWPRSFSSENHTHKNEKKSHTTSYVSSIYMVAQNKTLKRKL